MRRPRRLALLVSFACALGTGAGPAHAARVAPRGKVRVSLDTEFFAWTQARPYYPAFVRPLDPYPTRSNVIGFGPGRPTSIDGRPYVGGSVIALGVGYGVHRHLILGARVGMNFDHSFDRTDDPAGDARDDTTLFVGTFTPYLEILPLAEGRVLPFVLVRTGFTGTRSISRDGDVWTRGGSMAPQVGVGVGAHAFVTRYFSIDFGVTFDYRWIHGGSSTGGALGDPNLRRQWLRYGQSFVLAATLGLSTWF